MPAVTVIGPDYFTGLDMGQAGKFSALAVLERTLPDVPSAAWHYDLRVLERFPLGAAHHAVLERLVHLFDKPPLENTLLVVDQTAVGRPVADAFRRSPLRAAIRGVLVAAGASRTHQGGTYRVPKRELASVLQLALQQRRLRVPAALPHAQTLCDELLAFRPKVRVADEDALD